MSSLSREKILELNNTKVDYPRDKTINQLFEEQVKRSPHSIALVFEDNTLTYDELNKKADLLASLLKKRGVCTGSIVGILGNRSFNMIVAILGVLKAGAAYLPIDHTYPEERIRFMLNDSNANMLITWGTDELDIIFEKEVINIDKDLKSENSIENISLNTGTSNDLAYVIYTSGSTGKPKGVMIEHKSVVNFIKGVTDIIDFSNSKTILALTTISFDIFVLETLLALTQGLKIVICNDKQQKDPGLLIDLAISNRVDMLQITPSRMNVLLNHPKSPMFLKNLKEIMIGGEMIPKLLLEKLKNVTSARIYNMYGPTETTVWSSIKEMTYESKITIGKPIANTRIYILDEQNNVQPIGEIGELCIAGEGLARGYLNREDLTIKKFTQDILNPEERMYRTGDLAKWNENGEIEYIGRMDDQIKIRGYRIELGEIENVMLNHKRIKQAAVTVKEDNTGTKHLCAYYVPEGNLKIDELKNYILEYLPDYMMPDHFIELQSMPTTPNGKISKKELPEPNYNIDDLIERNSCTVQDKLMQMWRNTTKVNSIKPDDRFYEIGGNSMNLTMFYTKINEQFKINVQIVEFLKYPTIKELSSYIEQITKNYIV